MSPRAESIARRLSADLFDLRELARDDEETAHAIRIAVIAELRQWEQVRSLSEQATGD